MPPRSLSIFTVLIGTRFVTIHCFSSFWECDGIVLPNLFVNLTQLYNVLASEMNSDLRFRTASRPQVTMDEANGVLWPKPLEISWFGMSIY